MNTTCNARYPGPGYSDAYESSGNPVPSVSEVQWKQKLPMASSSLFGRQSAAIVDTYWGCDRIGNYIVGAFLGQGSFGRVFCAVEFYTRKEYAIKMIARDDIRTTRQIMDVEQEVAIMKHAKHPNVLRLHDVFFTPDYLCMVTELGYTSLKHWMQDNKVSPCICREIIIGLVRPVRYLHDIGIAHMDIKEENVLVMKNASPNEFSREHIKLCDFGLSKIDPSTKGYIEEVGVIGTKGYFAPEMAGSYEYDARAADMFSIGCLLLYASGTVPKNWNEVYRLHETRKDCFRKQIRWLLTELHCDDTHFQGVIPPLAEIIRGLLKFEPGSRLTAGDVMRHAWIVEVL